VTRRRNRTADLLANIVQGVIGRFGGLARIPILSNVNSSAIHFSIQKAYVNLVIIARWYGWKWKSNFVAHAACSLDFVYVCIRRIVVLTALNLMELMVLLTAPCYYDLIFYIENWDA
jgi:hypothetical protein